jgi:hypothetical protein
MTGERRTEEGEAVNSQTGVSECKFVNSSEKKNKKSTKIMLNQRNKWKGHVSKRKMYSRTLMKSNRIECSEMKDFHVETTSNAILERQNNICLAWIG